MDAASVLILRAYQHHHIHVQLLSSAIVLPNNYYNFTTLSSLKAKRYRNMAMIPDAFASYLSDMLIATAKEEMDMLLSVSKEISKFNDILKELKAYLADAERRHITDESARLWVIRLKDAMYEATDIADLIQIKVEEQPVSMVASPGCFDSFLFCFQDPLSAHRIGSRIKALRKKMDALLKKGVEELKFSSHTGLKVVVKTTPGIVHGDAIGEKIKQDTRMLVEMLTKKEMAGSGERNNVNVVAIVGVGGIGKTTLAKKIFNDQIVQESFDRRIWLSITQEFNKVDLLQTAISAADGNHHDYRKPSLLEPLLSNTLMGKKFLLVMDDMWSAETWEDVLRVPVVNAGAHGSRVLITTRNEGIAREMKAVHLHHVSKLGLQDAWDMLKKQVALSELEIENLKESGMKIVEKCDGLPLAIKVVGGVLCKNNRSKNDWEAVLCNNIWSKVGLPEQLNKAIYLSYDDLVPNLKQCFVYYSLFPKDEIIGLDKVVAMWSAEGFLGNDGNSRQLGIDYYKELIMRNLLDPQDDYYNQEHCLMHDVVRSFAQYVARDEALVIPETQYVQGPTSKLRRLSISAKEIKWSDLENQHSLRTLLLFGNIKFKTGDSLSTLSCLRTLHVRDAHCATLMDSLCHLKHLRYLELGYTDISALPQNIGKMKFLEHIGLRGCRKLKELPGSIINLVKLRHLSIDETNIKAIPRGFSRLENLEILWGFPVHIIAEDTRKHSCSLEDVGCLSQLRKLKLKGLENVPSSSMANLGAKKNLTCLELWCTSKVEFNGMVEDSIITADQKQIKVVFDDLCPPHRLEELTIGGYYGDMLPSWIMEPAKFLENLRRLDLQDLTYCVHLPAGLGQLPYLDCLVVDHAPHIERIGYEFFRQGGQMKIDNKRSPSLAAFPKLHELCLHGMMEWKEWAWEKHVEAMPILSVLRIKNCKLAHLPPGLACQANILRRLSITNVQHLNSLENFSSVVKLDAYDNPNLKRIAHFPKMQNLTVVRCPKLMLLDDVESLRSIQLGVHEMETLPEYLRHTNLEQLEIVCSLKMLRLMSSEDDWQEWEKISHIMHVKGFAFDSENGQKSKQSGLTYYVSYTKDPYSFKTNITDAFTQSSDATEGDMELR